MRPPSWRSRLLTALLASASLGWSQPAPVPTPAPSRTAPACLARVVPLPDDPQTRTLTDAQRKQVLDSFFNTVESRYLDPKFGGFDWKTNAELTRTRALGAATDALFYAELRTLVNRVGDGHFAFLSPQEAQQEDRQARGEEASYAGVGMTLTPTGEAVTVGQVFPGAPAEAAGVHAGDVIERVDGQDCPSADRIRGAVGSAVTLTLHSPGGQARDVRIVRARVQAPPVTVTASRLKADPSVGYLRFDSFFLQGVSGKVQQQLRALLAGGPLKALVIDLRLNGGGFVDEGTRFLGNFVKDQQATRVDRSGRREALIVRSQALYPQLSGVKLAVLVGPGTASMGEITGAILQQSRGAVVLGEGTARLTSNFTPVDLPFGARVHLTDVDVFLLNGTRLGERGVVPDVGVPFLSPLAPDADPVVARAVQALGVQP